MTTLEKTWTTITGESTQTTSSDAATHARSTIWTFKEKLKDNTTFDGYWTVVGSGANGAGGGGGMDNVDRWVAYTDLGSTNNWICLQSPNAIGPVYLTMIQKGTASFEYILATTKPTGGAVTTPPTQDGYNFTTGNQTWTVNSTKNYKITMGITSEGGFYVFETDGLLNQPVNLFGVLHVDGYLSGDPFQVCLFFKGMAGTYMNNSHLSNVLWMWHIDGSTVNGDPIVPSPYSGGYYYIFYDSNYWIVQDQFNSSGKWLDFPFIIWMKTTLKDSFRGRTIDIYLASDSNPNGLMDPSSGPPYTYVKFGAMWFPLQSALVL